GGAAGLLLLIAWANVTGLLLIRATRRRKEVAVRLALGARRAAIARLLSLEALLLVAAATAAGLAVCALSMEAIAPLIERELGRPAPRGLAAFAVDGQVMLAAALCGLVVAVAAGLSPLAVSWRADLLQPLQSGGRSATEGRGSQRTRSALIALEIAASLALLAGSVLMIQSVGRLMRVDFGIQGSQVLTTSLTLRQATYPDAASRAAFHDRVLSRLSTIPGVRSVALANWWPLQARPPQRIEAEGAPVSGLSASLFPVSPDYFGALGIPVVSGRTFAASDGDAGERVAIVSETFARRAWPDGGAVGSYIAVAEEDEHGGRRPSASFRIVGTVGDVRQTPADEDLADVYVPLRQVVGRFFFLHVRTSGPPMALLTAVRAAFGEIDPEVSLTNPRPLQAAIDEQVARPTFLAWLLTGFAAVAALVALVGVYGVIAYAVRQREREIAVRIALGAAPARITRLFLRQGSVVLAVGLALGLGGAVAAGRALQSQLFGVSPGDPATLAVSLAAFAAAALLAIWWPASRAAGANPVAALKED
ncbi:MAG TPA: FtsX-like permease family protein, partial [Vicinamibacterales bacterium]|nr:FtsX-like permease family protein [Vicinamibacterales bacterium]